MMDRSFSSHNLITQQLQTMTPPKTNLWDTLLEKINLKKVDWVVLQIKLPHYDLVRAKVFLEDLLEITEHEVTFSLDELLALLYSDFIRQVQTGRTKQLLPLSRRLQQKYEKYLQPKALMRRYREDEPNRWVLEEKLQRVTIPTHSLDIEMKRRAVLRGEVFLHDLASVNPHFTLTLEQLIATLFMEFMVQVKGGKTTDAVQALLHSAAD